MNDVQKALRERYEHVHPLLFLRCLEKAKTDGELFDLLHGMPDEFPLVWDEDNRRWNATDDLLQSKGHGGEFDEN